MAARSLPRRRFGWLALAGIILAAAGLLLALADSRAALAGWLTALSFWSGLPIGALGLFMMMRLIGGSWSDELAGAALTLLPLLLPCLVATLPLLLGVSGLYDWVTQPQPPGFPALYRTSGFFILRTVLIFLACGTLAALLVRHPARSRALSAGGIILYPLLISLLAVDWLMSLDAGFHSSGFGLFMLASQMQTALCALLLMRLASPIKPRQVGLLGGLLLTALLLWAYFSFMQYFILWSGNLPGGVKWFEARAGGGWSAAEYLFSGLQLLCGFLLFFFPLRRSRRWLATFALAVLAAKLVEFSWIVLPALEPGSQPPALLATLLSSAGLGCLLVASLPAAAALNRLLQPTSGEAHS